MKRIAGKINPEDRYVNIWGAGFSGLVLGYYLKDQGYKVTIYEKANKVGGKIQTKKTSSGLVEKGANALYLNRDGLDLLRELKLEPITAPKKLKRLLLLNGKPRQPFQLSLFSKIAFNSYRKPPLISDGLTVADFFTPLLGKENIENYLSPALGGLYASTAESLHFKSIFHQIENKAQFNSYWDFMKMMMRLKKSEPKIEVSGSVSFEGGMQSLIDRLAEILKPNIKLNYRENFRLKGNTIICTDAHSAAELLKELRPELSQELARINYRELSTVTVFLKREIKSLHKAFGVLIPLNKGFNSIGIVNNKAIFPANSPNVYSYTFIAHQKLDRDLIIQDLKLLNSDFQIDEVEDIECTHWDKALPVYDLKLFLAMRKIHQIARAENNLAIFGNYVAGISLREMITAAKNFSRAPQDYSENF